MKNLRIGRAADNDIRLDYPELAAHHAELSRVGDGWLLTDLGTNGQTAVNGWPVRRKVITDTDWIMLGGRRFQLNDLFSPSPVLQPDQAPAGATENEPLAVDDFPEEPNLLPDEATLPLTMTPAQAAELLSVDEAVSVDEMLANYRKKKSYLDQQLQEALTPGQRVTFEQAGQALDQAKEVMLAGYDNSLEHLPIVSPVINRLSGSAPHQLTPDPLPPVPKAPVIWYARPPLLWGALGVLVLLCSGLVYNRRQLVQDRDQKAPYVLTKAQFKRYQFLDQSFTPRQVRVINEETQPVSILGVAAMSYDTTDKGEWRWQPTVEQVLEPAMTVAPGTSAAIPFVKGRGSQQRAVFVSFMIREEEATLSVDERNIYQFAKALSPGADNINAKGEIEIRINKER